MKSSDVYQQLSSHDNILLEEDYVGFASSVLGIDIYAPNFADDKDCVCEGIGIAVKGYFDAIYKAENLDIDKLLSEAFKFILRHIAQEDNHFRSRTNCFHRSSERQ